MSKSVLSFPFPLFLFCWVLLNLLQAGFTQLDPDEAYYWVYAQQLDWGYFDHPPAAALLIKLGTWLFPGTLGLRFFIVLANALAFVVIWDLAERPQSGRPLHLLIALLVAMPFLHLYGFIATADAPLMLFSALFFWGYLRFLDRPGFANALLWAIIMAALLYSKYHGILLIFFTVLSNLRLFRQPWFYAAGLMGALLFVPHLYWQYSHDFPSFRYHLKGRDDVYELKYTLNYLLNQLVIFSPLLLPYIVLALIKSPVQDALQRSFRWVLAGFWLFFLWSTSKGHVEPQWTAILSIPLVLLLFAWEKHKGFNSKTLLILGFSSAALILLARVALLLLLPPLGKQFDNQSWISALQSKVDQLPVVFHNTYRNPALYHFYTQQKTYELTTAQYRKSQYDLWDDEVELQGKKVYLVLDQKTYCAACDTLKLGKKTMLGAVLEDFQVAEKITLKVLKAPQKAKAGDSIQVQLKLHNPYPFVVDPNRGTFKLRLGLAYHRDGQYLWEEYGIPTQALSTWLPGKDYVLEVRYRVPVKFPGELEMVFGLRYGELQSTLASEGMSLKVLK
ncbi:MAG: glycosyltransferase family 39 protein [Haliscomenobacter sp.]|uniref:ArnT family glycosyltransferase n=1 Tax=Haliscomenobacter sp. TaxID=2717303 RepID=UPI0029A99FD6|nr:glycosyltransferase family 39 protein [Haliscomenobacter sp.]MDX2069702.1 glycosyltransferase family 39 protein [Haliscomenobacter sp.]